MSIISLNLDNFSFEYDFEFFSLELDLEKNFYKTGGSEKD